MINLDSEQKIIQNEVRKFALQEIEPIVQDIENNARIPPEVFKKLVNLGLLSPIIPVESGGPGFSTASLCIIIEEISKICASMGLVVAVNNTLVAYPLVKYMDRKRKSYLDRLLNGAVGGFGINASDSLQVTNEKPLIVSGAKNFIMSGEYADFVLLELNLQNTKGLFVLDNTSNKITRSKPYVLGLKSAGITTLHFENLEIPQDNCIVDADVYSQTIHEIRNYFNIGLSAICLGVAEACLDSATKYAKERKQFGRPICEFAMVQEMLAEMKVRIEATRNLVFDAAIRLDLKEEFGLASKIAVLHATETAFYCGVKSVQVFGGYGYTKDYPVERYLRDAKTLQNIANAHGFLKPDIARLLL